MSEIKFLLTPLIFLVLVLNDVPVIGFDDRLFTRPMSSIQYTLTPATLHKYHWNTPSHSAWKDPSSQYFYWTVWNRTNETGQGNDLRRQEESQENHNESPREEEFHPQSHSDNMENAGHSQHSQQHHDNQVESQSHALKVKEADIHAHQELTHEEELHGSSEEEEFTMSEQLIPIIKDLTLLTLLVLYLPLIIPTILIPLAFYLVGIILIPIVRVNYFINHKDDGEDGRRNLMDVFMSGDTDMILKEFLTFVSNTLGFLGNK